MSWRVNMDETRQAVLEVLGKGKDYYGPLFAPLKRKYCEDCLPDKLPDYKNWRPSWGKPRCNRCGEIFETYE